MEQSAANRYQQQFRLTNKAKQKFLFSTFKAKPSCGSGLDIIKSPTCSNTQSLCVTLKDITFQNLTLEYLPNITRHFNCWLTGTGWAECTFANDKQALTFEFSYLSNPLADLFEGLFHLTTNKTNYEKIVFADEPGEHCLLLTRQENDKLKIEIFWSDEWEEMNIVPETTTKKELVYSDTDTLENFITVVCVGTEDLLKRTSLEEYKEKWHLYEFPIDSFNNLKATIKLG